MITTNTKFINLYIYKYINIYTRNIIYHHFIFLKKLYWLTSFIIFTLPLRHNLIEPTRNIIDLVSLLGLKKYNATSGNPPLGVSNI